MVKSPGKLWFSGTFLYPKGLIWFDLIWRNIEVNHSSFTAEWQITGKSTVSYNDVAAYTTFGTSRVNAYKILEDSRNLRDVRIYNTVEDTDGKKALCGILTKRILIDYLAKKREKV